MVAYAYAAQWPDDVMKLAMLDVPVPGTHVWDEALAKRNPQIWHFGRFQQSCRNADRGPRNGFSLPISTRSANM